MMPGKGRKRTLENDAGSNVEGATKKKRVSHRCYGLETGVVLTCGQGDVGQLGLGEDVLEKKYPSLVDIPDPIKQVCAGGMHTVCVTDKGELYTFGCNDEGALGRETSEEGSETVPGKVDLPLRIVQVSTGDSHTAALAEDGTVYAWGTFRDNRGSLGLTINGQQNKPVQILPDRVVIKIASGSDHLVCLTEAGDIYTTGCAEQGQLGRLAECFASRGGRKGLSHVLTPDKVRCRLHKSRKLARFTDIWTGQYMTFAQAKETGDIYAWGLNNYYQLGFDDMGNRFQPERVPSFSNGKTWQAISAGQHHTIALDTEGKVFSLGRAEYGRLGLGDDETEKSSPTLIPTLENEKIVSIGTGGVVSLALSSSGSVFAWGMGTNQQLGMEDEDDVLVPTKMKGKQLEKREALMVDAGGQHTVILAKDIANGH